MRIKQLKRELRERYNQFVKSVKCPITRDRLRNDTFISGGAITSLLTDDEINDIDVYFTDIYSAVYAASYFTQEYKRTHAVPAGVFGDICKRDDGEGVDIQIDRDYGFVTSRTFDYITDPGDYHVAAFSRNAITIVETKPKNGERPNVIQLIIRFVGTPACVHENFDFVHCTGVFVPATNRFEISNDALLSIMTRELRYVGSKYPVSSVIRTRKYIQRGWTINAGQYLKMSIQLSRLDLTDFDVLREQLIGVDAAYFIEFLDSCDGTCLKDVSDTTLSRMIDEIFDRDTEVTTSDNE